MFIKTKGMSIHEITRVGTMYPAVLCKFADGEYEVCTVGYDCDKNGENVVMQGYPVGWNPKNSGKIVVAYKVIFDETERNICGWHGDYTDETEPEEDERCYILVEQKKYGRANYHIWQSVYHTKNGFPGWSQSSELSVLGFMHIRKDGMPF